MPDDPGAGRGLPADSAKRPQDPRVELLLTQPVRAAAPRTDPLGSVGGQRSPGVSAGCTSRARWTRTWSSGWRTCWQPRTSPPEQPPFLGDAATRVTLRHDAPLDVTQCRRAGPVDEFDLDVRISPASLRKGFTDLPELLCGTRPDVACPDFVTPETCAEPSTCTLYHPRSEASVVA